MTAIPDALPVLSRGKHKTAAKGACFLEYTSLLAGEPFSDAPACVDPELAAVLRHANDLLSDADRPRLVPLLGRAVGLVAPPGTPTAALHRHVADLLQAAVGYRATPAELREHDGGRDLDRLFWFLMQRPVALNSSPAYVARLADRLQLLHACFEQALADAGAREAAQPACPETLTSQLTPNLSTSMPK